MNAADLFFERQRDLYQRGYRGRALFDRLAVDPEIPAYLTADEAAAISGMSAAGLAMRRARGQEPSYIAHSNRSVRYPTNELCLWLADMFVERRTK